MDELIYRSLETLPTLVLVLIIAAMLYVLSKGADLLVDQAVSLSVRWGVPEIVIGATIISLGTTLPEVTVSVLAAVNGNPDLALGNAIGSIIADTGLIIGLAAMIGELAVDRTIVNRQGRLQVLAGILLAFVCIPFSGNHGNIRQWVGWIFIALLITYITISIRWARKPAPKQLAADEDAAAQPSDEAGSAEGEVPQSAKTGSVAIQIFKLVAGITLVIASSKVLIPAVKITAIRVGIPQSIIAATLVALGTSLPELVTAITAVRKGHGALAVGNIVGADILNVLFVVGSAAAVTPQGLSVPVDFYRLQIPTMLVILLAFRLFTKGKDGKISRLEGSLLFAIYIAYIVLSYTWLRT
ncbi:MAG: calcium/sodium antiporter [Oscillospiraceae bacterium]|nr:calcium/sodium antiporter [Oscillospiraceae bacterium]